MEQDSYTNELKAMDLRLTEMEEKIDSIDKKLSQVIDAILGNSLTKTGGFIEEIQLLKDKIVRLEKKQEQHEEFKKKFSWGVGIIVTLGILIQYGLNIYLNLKK
jgi:predicted  nucleic acid-binding Zn-ribbon protein